MSEETKILRNKVKKSIKMDEVEFYKKKFNDSSLSIKKVWKTVYDILGQVENKAPTKIEMEKRLLQILKLLQTPLTRYLRIR